MVDIKEPDFVPPQNITEPGSNSQSLNTKPPQNPKSKNKLSKFWSSLQTKQKVLFSLVVILLLGGIVIVGSLLFNKKPPIVNVMTKKEEPKPETPKAEEPSRLTGRIVSRAFNLLPVTAVMIENSPDARPQAGLYDAGIVFEAIAEGGITRFVALFQDRKPAHVGPIRSVRPYYLSWILPFDAPLAHVGGSPDALNDIRVLKVRDLDQFSSPPGTYDRVSYRYSPHNVYTSIDRLLELESKREWRSSNFTSFQRKDKAPAATPTAKNITINISSDNYKVSYVYKPETNSYLRSLAGRPHSDEKSGNQISPEVVIALVTDKGLASDGKHSIYRTTGSGGAFIFQDGHLTMANWFKEDHRGQLVFKDASGAIVKLNPGQTWITVVGASNLVAHSP